MAVFGTRGTERHPLAGAPAIDLPARHEEAQVVGTVIGAREAVEVATG